MSENLTDVTLLDPDEALGLIPTHIQFQHELNEWEQHNIQSARQWAFSKKNLDILSLEFFNELHKKMFSRTWKWAGVYRKTQKNIGIDVLQIPIQLKILIDDVQYWLKNKTYTLDEIAIRIHHRLVYIHPYPNGNGRFSRLYTDLFLKLHHLPSFKWGKGNLFETGELRKKYIQSLKKADLGDYQDLLDFCK